MKISKILLFYSGLIFIFPAITSAAPIYLKCEISTVSRNDLGEEFDKVTGSKNEFSVKLDEASGKITHTSHGKTLTNSNQFNSEGFFSASSVSYQNKYMLDSESVVTDMYAIDRSNLNVEMTSQVKVPGLSLKVLSKTGACTVEKVKENKI